MEFWPPTEEAQPLVNEARALLEGPVKATIAAYEKGEASEEDPPRQCAS
jgi:hypothetical protein